MTLTTDFIKILMKLLGHGGGTWILTCIYQGGYSKMTQLTQGGGGV